MPAPGGGLLPMLTLLNAAVQSALVLLDVTAKPASAVLLSATISLEPTCIQLMPSVE